MSFAAIAPGRICLFGEHQDYLGLPVIAFAIPFYCRIHVTPNSNDSGNTNDNDNGNNNRIIQLEVPSLNETFRYDLDNLPPPFPQRDGDKNVPTGNQQKPDFALSAIHEALKDGWTFSYGARCISETEYTMQAGCSSSTAFCVAWVQVLAMLAGRRDEILDPMNLAKRAHQAEVKHFGAPGGTMDHVSCALGGKCCLRIGPGMWDVKRLNPLSPDIHGVWVLADSGESKDTIGQLKRCKTDRLNLLHELGGASWNDIKHRAMDSCDDDEKKQLFTATLTNRDTEVEAAELWSTATATDEPDIFLGRKLGSLMNRHYEALRDGLGLSTPKLETMRKAALNAGAWGFKFVGSGGGGYAVAWTPQANADAVGCAMKDAGAKSTLIIQTPSEGARIIL